MSIELAWFKSSYSDDGGSNCVEVAAGNHDTVHVRDSKDKSGPQLAFTAAAWAEFIAFAALSRGE
jgi:hypothetical protein